MIVPKIFFIVKQKTALADDFSLDFTNVTKTLSTSVQLSEDVAPRRRSSQSCDWVLQKGGDPSTASATDALLRLHPSHWPCLNAKGALGIANSRGVTGGEYKTRERIQRAVADTRLLAIPTSCRRVAAYNLNWGRFWGLAPSRDLAALCTDHCIMCVALDVRAMLIWRHPPLPPGPLSAKIFYE